jgi:hypothetical protein
MIAHHEKVIFNTTAAVRCRAWIQPFFLQQFCVVPVSTILLPSRRQSCPHTDCGESVGDDDGCTSFDQAFKGLLDQQLGFGVY